MTPDQITAIVKELENYEAGLFTASNEYRNLAREAAQKRAHYDVAYAQEILKLKSDVELKATVAERESFAIVAIQSLMTEARIAEALADGSKRHLGALQAILSSVQTRSKLLQSEWLAGGRQA